MRQLYALSSHSKILDITGRSLADLIQSDAAARVARKKRDDYSKLVAENQALREDTHYRLRDGNYRYTLLSFLTPGSVQKKSFITSLTVKALKEWFAGAGFTEHRT